jgi:serine/threonine-protein kinase
MTLGCPLAVKVLRCNVVPSDEDVERFVREATTCASIASDHVVRVLDLGRASTGELFMVMEYLDGESLAARLSREKTLRPQAVAAFADQVLVALEAAHAKGVVHRDVKPSNIFFAKHCEGERVKLLDFGICKELAQRVGTTTSPDTVVGTPAYMAPEQVRGDALDTRCDLYALGIVLFEASTGSLPYTARGPGALVAEIAFCENAAAKCDERIEPRLAAIVARALAARPAERYASAAEMRAAIASELLSDAPIGGEDERSSVRVYSREVAPTSGASRVRAG